MYYAWLQLGYLDTPQVDIGVGYWAVVILADSFMGYKSQLLIFRELEEA